MERSFCLLYTGEYLGSCQVSMMVLFTKIINDFQPLSIFTKWSIIYTWLSSVLNTTLIHYKLYKPSTAWKVSKYGVISGPYFHAFGLNMERYFVSLHIQSQCRKIGTRNYSVFGQFPCSEFSARAQNSAEWKTATSTLSFSSILRNSTVNFEVSIKIRTMSLVLNEF